MKMTAYRWTAAVALTLGAAFAVEQAPLLTLDEVRTMLTTVMQRESSDFAPARRGVYTAIKALDNNARTQLVRQTGALARQVLLSAEFRKSYDAYLQQRHRAVNHGLKPRQAPVGVDAAVVAAEEQMRMQMAQIAMSFREMPIDALKAMYPDTVEGLRNQANDADPADKPLWKKRLARAVEIGPWITSKPEEFRKAFSLLKSAEMGGPETEQELVQAGLRGKQEEEQRLYDQYRLDVVAKRRITQFIELAESVDFNATLAASGKSMKFVNPAYERRPYAWKLMYRLGKDPVMAAVEIAKSVRNEL